MVKKPKVTSSNGFFCPTNIPKPPKTLQLLLEMSNKRTFLLETWLKRLSEYSAAHLLTDWLMVAALVSFCLFSSSRPLVWNLFSLRVDLNRGLVVSCPRHSRPLLYLKICVLCGSCVTLLVSVGLFSDYYEQQEASWRPVNVTAVTF